jgi:hypothetical protein
VSDPTGEREREREREKRQAGTVVAAAARGNIYAWEEGHFVHIYIQRSLVFIIIICGASGAEAEGNMPDRHERRSADRTAV